MRKYQLLAALLCSVVLVLSTLYICQAQEEPQEPCDAACQALVAQLWQEGQTLQLQQQYEAAALRYEDIISANPGSMKALEASNRAGSCYRNIGGIDEALDNYGNVATIADALLPAATAATKDTLIYFKTNALVNRAEVYRDNGQATEAIQQCQSAYNTLNSQYPDVSKIDDYKTALNLQELSGKAIECLLEVGGKSEALQFHDFIIAIGNAKGNDEELNDKTQNIVTYELHINQAQALYDKAHVLAELGRINEARQAISQLKAYFAGIPGATNIGVLEAQINNGNVAYAQQLVVRESQASDMLKEAKQYEAQHNDQLALQGYNTVIDNYHDTAASLRAGIHKGLLLYRLKQYDAAKEAFWAVMQELQGTASQSRVYREARINYARTLVPYLGQKRRKGTITVADCDQLRTLCTQIINSDLSLYNRDLARLIYAESYSLQRDLPRCLAEVEAALQYYRDIKGNMQHFHIVASMHGYAGSVAYVLGQYDKAMTHFNWILEQKDMVAKRIAPNCKLLPYTYYRIWQVKRASGASETEVSDAAFTLEDLYPDSFYAELLPDRGIR